MSTVASIQDIESVLQKTFNHIKEEKIHFEPRKKNMDFINSNGISIEDALWHVEQLTYEEYYRGPSDEKDNRFPPGDYWEFGIPEDFCDLSMEVYVKIKELLHVDNMMCMSFHEAQYPITYPYRTT
ncbi:MULTISPECIES: hypothetical protein [Bacillus]|nr:MULTISPECIES: hypothetical protein [Bacillus]ONG80908.1 hypothetical protein BKK41_13500 [Bacillus cereus]COE83642.1 Uncharacterised protein [Streptococcus pneumoniae]MCU5096011.1 hypothetical protein [Bacillus wiedmannii]MDX6047339.1 hypothetical protein [Bacillus paranthracis]BCD27129.1 hypothetical protein BC30102_0165 [Bacillus cereus]